MPGHHPHGPNNGAATLQPGGYGALTQSTSAHLGHQPSSIAHVGTTASGGAPGQNGSASLDDEWRNIHVMLNCILGMVEKTKRALAILQRRGCSSPATAPTALQTPVVLANGAQTTAATQQQHQQDINDASIFKFRILVPYVEEAVQEVKRAAVAEVQRAVAVAVAESRASERLRSQRYLDSLPMNQQQQRGRPSPFLARVTATTATSSCGDDLDKDAHLQSGSVVSEEGGKDMEICMAFTRATEESAV
ncbi:PREDICTED: protein CBFA2T3-like [Ceratosolen solmsi marchali]|uniref:Protein CBFA2T3-like n=1 Tax=Ceratosolen solmsi marchali TaxID=326594 RepID=A0AAJ7E1U6_9HYME|nr:PREDICTED: protein CBFA2T3-like [Ceratosolen solmsi marchali]